jgi:hypothetical protein
LFSLATKGLPSATPRSASEYSHSTLPAAKLAGDDTSSANSVLPPRPSVPTRMFLPGVSSRVDTVTSPSTKYSWL